MSRYTTQFRYLADNYSDDIIFGQYPIFNESYRPILNQKIRDFYAFDEIGSETPARFAYRMRTYMSLKMPYFNQLYDSAQRDIDPFITQRYHTHILDVVKQVLDKKDNTTRDLTDIINDILNEKTHDVTNSTKDTTSKTVTNNIGMETPNVTVQHSGTKDDIVTHTQGNDDTTHAKSVTKTGSESQENGIKRNYEDKHVVSDTPESTANAGTISDVKYANAVSFDKHSETPTGKDTKTFNSVKDQEGGTTNVTNNQDTTTKNTINYSDTTKGSTGTTSDGTSDTIGHESGNITRDVEHGAVNDKTQTINEIISDIIKEIIDRETNNDLETIGFNNTTMSDMLNKWRSTFINTDMMVIDSLSDLFMGLLN